MQSRRSKGKGCKIYGAQPFMNSHLNFYNSPTAILSKKKGWSHIVFQSQNNIGPKFPMQKKNAFKKLPELSKQPVKSQNFHHLKARIFWFSSFNNWFNCQISSLVNLFLKVQPIFQCWKNLECNFMKILFLLWWLWKLTRAQQQLWKGFCWSEERLWEPEKYEE